jgi:hypothetical protein
MPHRALGDVHVRARSLDLPRMVREIAAPRCLPALPFGRWSIRCVQHVERNSALWFLAALLPRASRYGTGLASWHLNAPLSCSSALGPLRCVQGSAGAARRAGSRERDSASHMRLMACPRCTSSEIIVTSSIFSKCRYRRSKAAICQHVSTLTFAVVCGSKSVHTLTRRFLNSRSGSLRLSLYRID